MGKDGSFSHGDNLEVDAGLLEELRSRMDSFMQISQDMYRQMVAEYSEPIGYVSEDNAAERVTKNTDEEDLEEEEQIDTPLQTSPVYLVEQSPLW